jgi:long-chain acyl-CoA synthetase
MPFLVCKRSCAVHGRLRRRIARGPRKRGNVKWDRVLTLFRSGCYGEFVDPSRSAPAPPPVVRLLPQLAEFARRQYGETPFLLRHGPSGWTGLTFADAARMAHAFAALLEAEGVRPGDRVALQSENRPEWGPAYLGILESGAVVVPLDALLGDAEVGELLAAAGATHAVGSARQLGVLERARAARAPGLRLLALDRVAGVPGLPEALERFPDAPPREPRAAAHDLAVLIFTSGTTGRAKGVMLSHANLLANVEAVARSFTIGPGDRLLSVLPLHHTFECTAGFLCPLRVGASIAYARGLKSGELREDFRASGATILLGVPLLYDKLVQGVRRGIAEAPLGRRLLAGTLLGASTVLRRAFGVRAGRSLLARLRERAGLGRMRLLVSGAAALPAELFWDLIDLGLPVLEGYGLTECSPVVAANRPDRPVPGSVGWPLPGIEVRLAGVAGPGSAGYGGADAGEAGELLVRGPNVMLGYWGDPEATAEVLRDGWLATGDLARRGADGRLIITGRLKNMIATAAGKKIYPEEVEARLAGCPFVLEVVVAAGRDARGEREEVHAHVFPDLPALEALAALRGRRADATFVAEILEREIAARCADLAPFKRVRRVIVRTSEFPKTTTGKIRRQDLAAEPAKRVGAVA